MANNATPVWSPRLARDADVPALEALIPRSVRVLQAPFYSNALIEAALGPVFSVDRQLIRDGTYYVIEDGGTLVGCGGWSRRQALFGGDQGRTGEGSLLDPERDAARIRAFFVEPTHVRRGLGRVLLAACESALLAAGFRAAEMVATLAGEPLYAQAGYRAASRYEIPLRGELALPVVRMTRRWDMAPHG